MKNHVKLFEAFVNEVSNKKWREIEANLRGKGMHPFADRVASHRKEYASDKVASEIKLIGRSSSSSPSKRECYLSVTGIDVIPDKFFDQAFTIIGKDADWGNVNILVQVNRKARRLHLFLEDTLALLATDRKNAQDLIDMAVEAGVIEPGTIDWRTFTQGYTDFDEIYTKISF
jgi:hypothetical protein